MNDLNRYLHELEKVEGCSSHAISLLKEFLAHLSQKCRISTIKSYSYDITGFVRWFESNYCENFEPSKLSSQVVIDYTSYLENSLSLNFSSIKRKLFSIKRLVNWSLGNGKTSTPIAFQIPKLPFKSDKASSNQYALNREEQILLLRVIKEKGSLRDITIIQLLMMMGLKVSELCSLKWADIEISNKSATLTVKGDGSRTARELPIIDPVKETLLLLGYTDNLGRKTNVFLGKHGPLTPRGIEILIKKYAQSANLRKATPQLLRHTFGTMMAEAGVPLETLTYMMGHKSANSTHAYYKRKSKDEVKRQVCRVFEVLEDV